MTRFGISVFIILLLVVLGFSLFFLRRYDLDELTPSPSLTPTPTVTPTPSTRPIEDLIQVDRPKPGDTVSSPLKVSGQARGFWFFEASFPITLLDADGKELAKIAAQASGSWMTEDFVPFSATLKFQKPKTATGLLIFEKDNPSGLPENAASYSFQVKF